MMKHTRSKWMGTILLTDGLVALTGCSHDMDDNTLKPYSVTDQQRQEYAEQVLGTSIDPQQDWVLTQTQSVKVTADADVDGISRVAILDGNPFAEETMILAQQTVTKGQTTTLSFRAAVDSEVLYTWYPVGQEDFQESFLIPDSYDCNVDKPKKDLATKKWKLNGHYLLCRQTDLSLDRTFTPGDRLWFQLTDSDQVMGGDRVKVFSYNGYVFIACEDGNDWDYNDRVYWIPEGQEHIEKAGIIPPKPEPTKPQLWTYAWEDNTMEEHDVCDYDMNDYYMLRVATAGTDPHGIVIPGKWQWPTEKTCIKNAYLEFNTWVKDRTQAKDWYRHPVAGKVVER